MKTWQKLKCILLDKRSQFENATYCMIPITRHSRKWETIKPLKTSVMPGVQAEGRMNKWSSGQFWDSETILYNTGMANTC